jgi:hypothetical protein
MLDPFHDPKGSSPARATPSPNKILVHLSADGRIIARLYVMGGTIAKLSTGLATLSGHRPQPRPRTGRQPPP